MGPSFVGFIWSFVGFFFFGCQFKLYCWIGVGSILLGLLFICEICLVSISVILLDWCGSDLFGSGGRWAVRPG